MPGNKKWRQGGKTWGKQQAGQATNSNRWQQGSKPTTGGWQQTKPVNNVWQQTKPSSGRTSWFPDKQGNTGWQPWQQTKLTQGGSRPGTGGGSQGGGGGGSSWPSSQGALFTVRLVGGDACADPVNSAWAQGGAARACAAARSAGERPRPPSPAADVCPPAAAPLPATAYMSAATLCADVTTGLTSNDGELQQWRLSTDASGNLVGRPVSMMVRGAWRAPACLRCAARFGLTAVHRIPSPPWLACWLISCSAPPHAAAEPGPPHAAVPN